jgi:ATP-dependent Clp endopeptidase proteolytic subunit ClpP
MRSWYEIKAKKDSADVYIYDEIGVWGITASAFVNELRGLKGKALNVYINSPGGSVFEGIAIYNALSRHEGGVNVTVDSLAASIASVIAQAGETRTMAKSSAMMIHDAWGIAVGDPATMEKMRDELEKLSDSIADIYADRAGGTAEEWRSRMADETWYKADDAVAAGLADAVAGVPQNAYAGRAFNLSKFSKVPEWVNQDTSNPADEPGDEPEIKEDDVDEKAIRQALGLDEEGDILAAVSGLHTEIATLKATLKDQDPPGKDENRTLKRALAESQMKYVQLETEKDRKIVELQSELRVAQAEHRVDAAIQAGRVAPAQREMVLNIALRESEEDFTAFIKGLPSVDFTEHGGAGGGDYADFEPTPQEIAIAKQMGNWDEAKPAESRLALMRAKAGAKGVTIPASKEA